MSGGEWIMNNGCTLCLASLLLIAMPSGRALAQAVPPPSPQELSQMLMNLWAERRFDDFEAKLESLKAQHPGYIPGIIARGFWKVVKNGDLSCARETMMSVLSDLVQQNASDDDEFLVHLKEEIRQHDEEMQMHEERQHHVVDAASPEAVRNALGDIPPPILRLVRFAPEKSLSASLISPCLSAN
jgi:hypothetical protein